MEYIYLGRRVTVVRTTSGGVAQLSTGEWVNMGMLSPVSDEALDVKAAGKSAVAKAKAKAKESE